MTQYQPTELIASVFENSDKINALDLSVLMSVADHALRGVEKFIKLTVPGAELFLGNNGIIKSYISPQLKAASALALAYRCVSASEEAGLDTVMSFGKAVLVGWYLMEQYTAINLNITIDPDNTVLNKIGELKETLITSKQIEHGAIQELEEKRVQSPI